MNYELVKQLREAGYPTNRKKVLLGRYEKVYKKSETDVLSADYEYVPTLEELIEACGDRFQSLRHYPNNYKSMKWNAGAMDLECGGETPEEAVANLYLELHKK